MFFFLSLSFDLLCFASENVQLNRKTTELKNTCLMNSESRIIVADET